ncbi:hypothetical protein FSP39_000128 [Pinctada imbricata]|uniref:Polycystin cation channel PKD1/PKD2 domain-containing protein n=1 Tax=Pinctada imbricata TaxID=66713 RepID=A0AA88XTN5_PINIB|nr:hypothetical protein FSP39_000128 [Pinctada imbricata]
MTSFKWEFPSMGGTAQKHTVTSFRLYPYMDPFDYLILVVQLCFIVFTLVKIVRIFYRFSNTLRGYREILLHLLKTALVLLSVTVIVVYVIRIDRTIFTIEKIFNNKEQFISFDQLIFLDDLYKMCLSILIFFHILFLLRHLTYNFHIYLLQNTIRIASGQIISCMVFLGIAIIAFSSLQYLFTGRKLSDYRSLYNAMLSLICAALSTAKLSSGKSEIISPFDKLTFFLFGLIVNLILLNLFISILNETLSALKTGNFVRGSIPTFDKELNQFVWEKISKIFSLCGVHPQDQSTSM